MSKSRTIGWVLLIAAAGAAGYYGWQKYQVAQQTAKADDSLYWMRGSETREPCLGPGHYAHPCRCEPC